MRHLYILIGCVFAVFNNANAQDNNQSSDKDFGFSILYEQCVSSNIQPKGWETFVSTYNQVNSPTQALTSFHNKFMMDIGVRLRYKKYFASFIFERLNRECSAGFSNNESRIFTLQNNAVLSEIGKYFVRVLNQKLNIGASVGMRVGASSYLFSSYKYQDGFESYGGEKSLNGSYIAPPVLGVELSAIANYKLYKGLMISLKLGYQFNNNVAPSSYTDLSDYKALNPGTPGAIVFPLDYTKYTFTNIDNDLKSSMKGYKLNIGIAYEF
ncbi:MAG: hypothetical protein JSU07_04785 [Bacteroidetes bacterium]|nr:hypothetical protein [Bacteroidota bacterium]